MGISPDIKSNQQPRWTYRVIILVAVIAYFGVLVTSGELSMTEAIIGGIAAAILIAIWVWFYNSKYKKWFPKREDLCFLQFLNKDKHHTELLSINPNATPQNISVWIRADKIKTIDSLSIRFGAKLSIYIG
jgi:hypothetical protein